MTKVGFITDEIFLRHKAPQGHPETQERLEFILKTIKTTDIWENLIHLSPRRASYEEIGLVHSRDYIELIEASGPGYLDPDTYFSEGSREAACFAAGAVVTAVENCRNGNFTRAFCAVRPPGHHAEADHAMGFCIFNNIAIGVRFAQKCGFRKVFIVDFDVHHGNGTQHIFEEDDTVFYFSTHQFPHYPGTGSQNERGKGKGENFTFNVPVPHGAGDEIFTKIYREVLPVLVKKFSPDLLLVSAGYDIRAEDPLAGIQVSSNGIEQIIQGILAASESPAIFALEGGYDLPALADSVFVTLKSMLYD